MSWRPIRSKTKSALIPCIFRSSSALTYSSQAVLVDVEGGRQRPLAGHAAHVAAGPQLVALLEAEGAVDQGGQVHQVDAAEGLKGVHLSS